MPNLFTCIPEAREGARMGNNPFGFPSPKRANWNLPVGRLNALVHPAQNRLCTYGELASLACWCDVPRDAEPMQQLLHSGFERVGTWIAEQVIRYTRKDWGEQDYESRYNSRTQRWEGRTTHEVEKTFDFTEYHGAHRHIECFPVEATSPPRRIRFLGNKWIPCK